MLRATPSQLAVIGTAIGIVAVACAGAPTDGTTVPAEYAAPAPSPDPAVLSPIYPVTPKPTPMSPGSDDLAPNEVSYEYTGEARAPRAGLAKGAELANKIAIPTPRFIGAFARTGNPGQTLTDYVGLGALGKTARLQLRVFNTRGLKLKVLHRSVQSGNEWTPLKTYDPDVAASPRQDVLVPESEHAAWSTVTVSFPIEQIALAQAKGKPENNDFKLVVEGVDPSDRAGDAAFAWAKLAFFARAPVVLMHGINDNQKNCWPDYAEELARSGFVADTDVDVSGLSDNAGTGGASATFNGSVADNVERIRTRLSRLALDYGTSDVHLVGHSKGGLDFVNFLAGPYREMRAAHQLRVLTLQTLGTPHAGSVTADIVAPLKRWGLSHGYSGAGDWPDWGVVADSSTDTNVLDTVTLSSLKATVLARSGPIEPGLSDLMTTSEPVVADQAWRGDPTIKFVTYGWDADFERSQWVDALGHLTTPPETGDLFPKFSTDCRGNPSGTNRWSQYCIDEDEVDAFFWGTALYPPQGTACSGWNICGAPLWRPMARGIHATVASASVSGGTRSTIRLEPAPKGTWLGNDLVVSLLSAAHPHADSNVKLVGSSPRRLPNLARFKTGGGIETYTASCAHTGANHISILRRGRSNMVQCTAADTMEWIRKNAALK